MTHKKTKIIYAIVRKEFLHILHDPRSLMIIFLLPVVQLVMFGYALKMEIQEVKLGIVDFSHSTASREFIQYFSGSHFFKPFFVDQQFSEIDQLFKKRRAQVILIIAEDFAEHLQRNTLTGVQVLIDASDANAATMIRQYMTSVINNYNRDHSTLSPMPFEIENTFLYNPDKKSTYFFVPGLIALLLIIISALLTSITIAREKETGTLEQILVSPVQPSQIVIGKVLPYIVLAFSIGVIILVISVTLFKVPFKGSIILLMLLSTLYIITALSLGLMVSTIARTQQVAMMVVVIVTLLPTMMLSGFIFPISSIPRILQYVTYIVPARYFLHIVRGIILKGSSFIHLLVPTVCLMVMSSLLLIVAVRKFSLTLEK